MTPGYTVWALDTDTNGALSCINNDGVMVFKLPNFEEPHGISKKTGKFKTRTRLDQLAVIEVIKEAFAQMPPHTVVFEAQRGRPNQSSVATYTFGECNGFLRGAVKAIVGGTNLMTNAAVSYLECPAATWKPGLGLDDDKSKAHRMAKAACKALSTIPEKTSNDSLCESFLLGLHHWISARGDPKAAMDFVNISAKVSIPYKVKVDRKVSSKTKKAPKAKK